jgi:hypothetical protein
MILVMKEQRVQHSDSFHEDTAVATEITEKVTTKTIAIPLALLHWTAWITAAPLPIP